MRYSKLLDRTLYAISLLHQGDVEASATVLAEALDDPDFESQFVDLNEDVSETHRASALESDSDPQTSLNDVASQSDEDSWDDVLNNEGEIASTSITRRRTEMMLRNLKVIRGG